MTTDPDFDAAAASDEPDAPTRRWPVLLIGAVVLALGLTGGWFGLRALQGNQREDAIRAVATDFYAALAASDATKAASLSATPLPTSPLLTAKALAASQKSAPISAATVSDIRSSDESPKAVAKVSYQVGQREVTTDMGLTRTGEAWKLDDVWTALVVPTTTGVLVNGEAVPGSPVAVFPGTYTATSASPLVAVTAQPATVEGPGNVGVQLNAKRSLTDAGRKAAVDATKQRLAACVAATVSAPKNCPWSIADAGASIVPNSVRYKLVGDPWASYKPELADRAGTVTTGRLSFRVDATASMRYQGVAVPVSKSFTVTTGVAVTLGGKAPVVVFTG